MPVKTPTCRYPTRSGAICQAPAAFDDNGCLWHSNDPEALAARRRGKQLSSRGRSNAGRVVKLLSNDPRWSPLADRLMQALDEVMDGTLDSHRGMSVSQITRAIVQLVDVAEAVAKLEALESEVAALRDAHDDQTEVYISKTGGDLKDDEPDMYPGSEVVQ